MNTQTRGVDVGCERYRDNATTNSTLRYYATMCMKTELKYISSAFSSSLAQEVHTHIQTCGVDVPCERDRDDGTTNKLLRYENKTYWNVPSASSLVLSLKMHTQTPGVDVRFER